MSHMGEERRQQPTRSDIAAKAKECEAVMLDLMLRAFNNRGNGRVAVEVSVKQGVPGVVTEVWKLRRQ